MNSHINANQWKLTLLFQSGDYCSIDFTFDLHTSELPGILNTVPVVNIENHSVILACDLFFFNWLLTFSSKESNVS